MTTLDLIYVALLVLVLPAIDYAFGWPAFKRRHQADPDAARRWLWNQALWQSWLFVAIGAALWSWQGRTWADMKLTLPEGWRLALAIAVVVAYTAYPLLGIAQLRRDPALRARVLATMGGAEDVVPHTRSEARRFVGVSITAGFCEEFQYRGYLLWALAPWIGFWGAAALSTLVFGIGHIYQGWGGVLRTGIFGAIYAVMVWAFDSLWPSIVLHVLVDALNGVVAWIILREDAHVPASE